MVAEDIGDRGEGREGNSGGVRDVKVDLRGERRVGDQRGERRGDALTVEEGVKESRKTEVGEAAKPEVGVESFADDPGPVGAIVAEVIGLEEEGEERVAGGGADDSLGGGPVHREE